MRKEQVIINNKEVQVLSSELADGGGSKYYLDKVGGIYPIDTVALFGLAQTAKVQELSQAYTVANEADIVYNTNTFQADKASQDLIAQNLAIGTVPAGFYWP